MSETQAKKSRLKYWVIGGFGAVAVMAGIGVVNAQFGHGGSGRGWGGEGPRHGMGGPGSGMREMRGERFARFCNNDTERYHPVARAFAKADLRMTAAQQAEFDKLADLVLPAMIDIKKEACSGLALRTAPSPEKLAKLAAVLRKAADAAEKAVEPTRQFYVSLDADQKARVDQVTSQGPGRRGGMMPGGPRSMQ